MAFPPYCRLLAFFLLPTASHSLAFSTINQHHRPSLLPEARAHLGDPPLAYTVISNCHHIDTTTKFQSPSAAHCFGYDVEHTYRTTNDAGNPHHVEASNLKPQPRTCLSHTTSDHSQTRENSLPKNPKLNQQAPSQRRQHVLVNRPLHAASNAAKKNGRKGPY